MKISKSTSEKLNSCKNIRTIVADRHKKENCKSKNVTNFDDGNEHDAALFLRAMLECLGNEFKSNWVKDLTEHKVEEEQNCNNCDFSQTVNYKDVLLVVAGESKYIEKGIESKLEAETAIVEHNCTVTKNEVNVTKKLVLKPKLLLIQINRFKMDDYGMAKKMMNKVRVKEKIKVEQVNYILDSSINHEGPKVETGHCIVNVYNFKENIVIRCSDSVLSKRTIEKLEQTYVAVFRMSKEVESLDNLENLENLETEDSVEEWQKANKRKKPALSSSSSGEPEISLVNKFSSMEVDEDAYVMHANEAEIDKEIDNIKRKSKTKRNARKQDVFNKDCGLWKMYFL